MTRPARLFCSLLFVAAFLPSPTLAAFVTLSGTVTDQNGVGIFGVQINFADSCTGVTAGATGNVTSATGTFRATVSAGIYDLEFVPPVGSVFTALKIPSFDLTTSKTLATVVLPFGVVVSGHVTDTSGVPVSGVQVRFYPPGGSDRVFTANDKTDASGNYNVVVLAGTYDLRYRPPAGTSYLTFVVLSVSIQANITLPTVALQTGLIVSGIVDDSAGSPVINVGIHPFDAATGVELTVTNNHTDVSGTYSVTVPPGTYLFEYKPPQCTLLVGQKSGSTAVSADLTLPTVKLPTGVLVKGTVTDTHGTPVANVDTKYTGSSGLRVVTTNSQSDTNGAYSAVVPLDTYSIEYVPPAGVRLAGVKLRGVNVNSNPTTLPTVQLPSGFFVTGRTVTSAGTPVFNVDIQFFVAGTTSDVYVANHTTDISGNFSIVTVSGTYDILFTPPSTTGLGSVLKQGIAVSTDIALGDIVLPPLPLAVTSITPNSGSTVGGQAVTVSGTSFQPGATLGFGGVTATVVSVSSTTLQATTPAHPAGVSGITVSNPGGPSATLPTAYTFQEPVAPIALTVTLSGNDVVLQWSSTGQTSYTVFESSAPTGWADATVLTKTSATTYTVVGGALGSGIQYFNVD